MKVTITVEVPDSLVHDEAKVKEEIIRYAKMGATIWPQTLWRRQYRAEHNDHPPFILAQDSIKSFMACVTVEEV
jgi:hypothetical protein